MPGATSSVLAPSDALQDNVEREQPSRTTTTPTPAPAAPAAAATAATATPTTPQLQQLRLLLLLLLLLLAPPSSLLLSPQQLARDPSMVGRN